MKFFIAFAIFISYMLCIPLSLSSRTIWRDRNIYASGTNLNVGDVIVVNINDVSQLRFNLTFNNDNSYNIVSNPDTTVTGFLPKINSNKKISSSDKADLSGKGGLTISIASRVLNRLAGGKLTIAGVREYSFNGKINRFAVSGIVDPELVKGRSVLSKNIADFRLEIRGLLERSNINIEREELKEDEASSTSLTEDEKQKIIIDYLNKMLREISR
ncbi:MAG: flagellar basal body L-ring protein FlgH [Spirochaetes bacterium]|nr:flagellar basal body L-ring protein FlgH [Spirochaetota bacterium]